MWKTLVCVCVCVCARITQNILLHQQETALERVAFSVLLGACAVQKLYTHTHATRNTTVNPTLISSTDMCACAVCSHARLKENTQRWSKQIDVFRF